MFSTSTLASLMRRSEEETSRLQNKAFMELQRMNTEGTLHGQDTTFDTHDSLTNAIVLKRTYGQPHKITFYPDDITTDSVLKITWNNAKWSFLGPSWADIKSSSPGFECTVRICALFGFEAIHPLYILDF